MADRPVHHYHSAHDGGESLPRRSGERGNALSMAEQSAIDEYSQLLSNLNSLTAQLDALSFSVRDQLAVSMLTEQPPNTKVDASPGDSSIAGEILDSIRILDKRTMLIFTALKSSVYRMVLQQGLLGDEFGRTGDGTVSETPGKSSSGDGTTPFGNNNFDINNTM